MQINNNNSITKSNLYNSKKLTTFKCKNKKDQINNNNKTKSNNEITKSLDEQNKTK
jgi:hypothetical protein